jgi:hydrogenase maturation protease
MPLLVIGYGNPLRGDDGLGWRVAEEWQARRPEAAVLVCQQLTPELAEPLSRATQAAFVDIAADSPPGALTITPLQPEAPTSASFTHQLTPSAVLYLAQALYGQTPLARLYSVGGQAFGYEETLSAKVTAAMPELIRQLEAWAEETA